MENQKNNKTDWHPLSFVEELMGLHITGLFLLISTFGIFIEIILRKMFLSSIFGLEEIVSFSMMILTFLTLSINQKDGQHVKMDLIMERLEPKSHRLLELTALLLSLSTFIIVTYAGVLYCMDLYLKGAITVLLAWPFWPVYLVVPVGSLLLCLRLGLQFKEKFQEPASGPDHLVV